MGLLPLKPAELLPFHIGADRVAAWQELHECLRELAEMNKERNLRCAREARGQ